MELKIDAKNALGECILWCDRLQRLLWTDILGESLWAYQPVSGKIVSWPMPERLASFALTDDNDRLLLGLASQLAYFNFSSGSIAPICQIEADMPTTRVNDGRCDRQGRFVFGTLNETQDRAPIASFYRLNADLTLQRLELPHIAIANSICFSPDGGTLYYCDSLSKSIRCCSYDAGSGPITNDRLFADLSKDPGEPDGSAIDADGYLWNAQWGGWRIVRYTPDGSIDRVISLPVAQPSCLTFGDPDHASLYITSARTGLSGPELRKQPHAGGVFYSRLDTVRGLPEQRFMALS
ncbi:SMP-30/gluconolactonase/LRE family protein [Undibacterium sp. Jales W-56]|uniref:SMP-30/gluconolactonase/LRE family protein n=1 Tax=Undibacterium sp. Jales W-56 TaxID=2897325 RepID=UPI0021D198A3|nr:SMP-30/gluconolactonase/LRE family protein [Undibacterium sp. Jales W-56]MCU6432582.1 SMP-30/gluconolactonase/LRE family protein [Undibacterium sp. Jales W-56]